MFKRTPRYGTPLPPGRRRFLLPEIHPPRTRGALIAALRRRRIQARLGLGLVGLVVFALVLSFVTAAPPGRPEFGVDEGFSRLGPLKLKAPVGWAVKLGSDDFGVPWVLIAPQNDPGLTPISISFSSVDVTERLRALDPEQSTPAPGASAIPSNARALLEKLVKAALVDISRGPYCTLDLPYGSQIGTTGILAPAVLVEWQTTIPPGYKLLDKQPSPLGPSSDKGICPGPVPTLVPAGSPSAAALAGRPLALVLAASPKPTAKPTAKPIPTPSAKPPLASPTPASLFTPGPSVSPGPSGSPVASPPPSPAPNSTPAASGSGAQASPGPARPPLHQVQWFALPSWSGFRNNESQHMLVITLSYPDGLTAAQIAQARAVFDAIITSVNSSIQ